MVDRLAWEGFRSLIFVASEDVRPPTRERRFYLSSLPGTDAGRAALQGSSAMLSDEKHNKVACPLRGVGAFFRSLFRSSTETDPLVAAAQQGDRQALSALSRRVFVYKRGHTAQLVAHDYAAALLAWDAYLAHVPRGRFAVEARYNRGSALVACSKPLPRGPKPACLEGRFVKRQDVIHAAVARFLHLVAGFHKR